MKSLFTRYRRTYLFFGISLLFYYAQDLLSLTLQVDSVELVVISLLLSWAGMFVTFGFLLVITIMTKLKNPAILFGLCIAIACSFLYTHLANQAKVGLYFQSNRGELITLVEEVSRTENDADVVRVSTDHSFVEIYYWDVFLADGHVLLEDLMDRLQIIQIKKHSAYTELSVMGYSSNRLEELTLFCIKDEDGKRIYNETTTLASVFESSHIEDNWYYVVHNYGSLDDRHAYWGHNSKPAISPQQAMESVSS